jgi:ATP-binding cassette, subfamily B, multidrug efflux pump
MTEGQIVAFTNYLTTTMGPLMMMALLANVWANGIASAGASTRSWTPSPRCRTCRMRARCRNPRPAVVFDNVSFHYNGSSDGLVLEDINLSAAPGQMVAMLGAPGRANPRWST